MRSFVRFTAAALAWATSSAGAQAPAAGTLRLRAVDSLVIESSAQQPLVRLSGFARSRDGWMALSDLSEGVVRLHAPDGRLARIIGRRGEGPGEFRAPVLPRFDAAGRLHVPDIALLRISVFELPPGSAPRLVRTVPFGDALGALFGFELHASGDYLLAGPSARGSEVLTIIDSLGKVRGRHVGIAKLRRSPAGPQYESLWQALQVPSVATDGQRVFVTLSTFDSLWIVNPSGRAPVAWHLPIDGYRPPSIPTPVPQSRQDIRSWATSQLVTTVFANESWLLVPAFRGTYNEGRTSDVLARPVGGAWSLLRGVSTVLAVRGDTVFSLRGIEEPIRVVRQVLTR